MAKALPEEGVRFADPDSLESQVREYAKVKSSLDMLEGRQRILREALFEKIDEEGFTDDKGNVVLELESEIEGCRGIEKSRRVTRKLDELVAEEIIEQRQLGEEVYKTIRVIDEDALMAAMYDGKVTEEEIDRMFPAKVVWALIMKKK